MAAERGDPDLYRGSAVHYAVGRIAYPAELADAFARELSLDGTGRLLDVGCGPGQLTLLLAPWFAESLGVDADPDMVVEARRRSGRAPGLGFRQMPAEELPDGLGVFDLVTFAQSFHWLDRPRVAAAVRGMLAPGGACAIVHATMHHGIDPVGELPHPRPPHDEIATLIRRYLGSTRVAPGDARADAVEVFRAAGYRRPRCFEVPGRVVTRTADQLVAAVYSLSTSTPYLFGDRREAFEQELRGLLRDAAPDGLFAEQTREIAVDLWRV